MIGNDSLLFGIGLDTRGLQGDANRAKNILGDITKKAQLEGKKLDNTFQNLAKGVSVVFSSGVLAGFVGMMAKTRGEFQQLEVAFTTMLGSKAKADALMARTVEFAAKTPFDLQGVAEGTKQLLAYGSEAENVTEELSMLGNIASGLSMPLNDLVYLYGTTRVQGQLYMQDLKQFQNRGIPIVAELAKQYDVSQQAVKELVTAGKVGFKDVERAMKGMTAEGAMFYNLMEEQSKTITGKMSNLGDAVSQMFNKIGEANEGAMSTALDSAVYLVENYKEVAKIIGELIATYGIYRAALIATTVIQSTAIKMTRIQALTTKQLTIAQQLGAVATLNLRNAMRALSASMLANPAFILSAAIAGLIYLIVKLITAQTAEERALENVNELLKEQADLIEEQKNKSKNLISVIQDETSTINQKEAAYIKLQKMFPDYFGNMSMEQVKALEATEAYKGLNAELEKKSKLQTESTIAGNQARIAELEDLKNKFTSPENVGERGNIQSQIDLLKSTNEELERRADIEDRIAAKAKERARFEALSTEQKIAELEAQNKFLGPSANKEKGFNPVDNLVIETANKTIQENNKKLAELRKNLQREADEYFSLSKTEAKIAEQQKIVNTLQAKAKKGEVDGSGGLSATEKTQLDQALEELDRLEKEKKTLTKAKDKDKSASNYDAVEITRQNKRELENIEYESNLAILNAKEDGAEKELKILELKHEKELQAIERQKEDRLSKVDTDMKTDAEEGNKVQSKEDWNLFKSEVEKQYNELASLAKARQDKDKSDFVTSRYKQELEDFKSYSDEYLSKTEKFENDLKEMKKRGATDEEISRAKSLQDDVLATLASEMDVKEAIIKEMSVELIGLGFSQILEQLEVARAALKTEIAGSNDEQKVAKLQAKITVLQKLLSNKTNKTVDEVTDEDWNKTVTALHEIMETANDVIDSFSGISEEAKEVAKATINIAGSAIGMISGIRALSSAASASMTGTAEAASAAISTVEKASIVLAVVSAALQIAMTIASLFNKDKRKEKDIERLQVRVDALKKSYKALEKAIDGAYASRAKTLIQEEEANLIAQRAILEQQIAAERNKKKTDNGRIVAWMDAIDEIDAILADSEARQVEAINGTSVQSALEEFAKAYADAWSAGEDKAKAMKDVVRNMVQGAITEMIKMRMSGEVEKFANYLAKAMDDGMITSMEGAMLNQLEDAIYNTMNGISDTLDPYMDDSEDTRNALTGGFTNMSQDTADELNGRFTVIQGHTFAIVENMAQIQANSASQLVHLAGIHTNTESLSRLATIESDMAIMKSAVTDLNDIGIRIRS